MRKFVWVQTSQTAEDKVGPNGLLTRISSPSSTVPLGISVSQCGSLFSPVWPPWSHPSPQLPWPTGSRRTRKHASSQTLSRATPRWPSTSRYVQLVIHQTHSFSDILLWSRSFGYIWWCRMLIMYDAGPIWRFLRCRLLRHRTGRQGRFRRCQGATGRLCLHCAEHRRVHLLLQQWDVHLCREDGWLRDCGTFHIHRLDEPVNKC